MPKDIDILSAYQNPSDGRQSFLRVGTIILIVCLVLVLGLTGYFRLSGSFIENRIDDADAYLSQNEVVQANAKVNQYQVKNAAMQKYFTLAQSQIQKYNALTMVDSNLIYVVAKSMPASLTVTDLNISGGSMTLICDMTDHLAAADFSHALENTGKFDAVAYNAVSENGTGQYTSTITASIKGAATK